MGEGWGEGEKGSISTTYLPLPLIPSHKGRGNGTFYETIKATIEAQKTACQSKVNVILDPYPSRNWNPAGFLRTRGARGVPINRVKRQTLSYTLPRRGLFLRSTVDHRFFDIRQLP